MFAVTSASVLDPSRSPELALQEEPDSTQEPALPGAEFLERGLDHAAGRSGPTDLVAAHKFFNLAAMHGHPLGVQLRREIASDMSPAEIAAAQRAARDWATAQVFRDNPPALLPPATEQWQAARACL